MNGKTLTSKNLILLFCILAFSALLADTLYGELSVRSSTRKMVEISLKAQSALATHAFDTHEQSVQLLKHALETRRDSQLALPANLIENYALWLGANDPKASLSQLDPLIQSAIRYADAAEGTHTVVISQGSQYKKNLGVLLNHQLNLSPYRKLLQEGNLEDIFNNNSLSTIIKDQSKNTIQPVFILYDSTMDQLRISTGIVRPMNSSKYYPPILANPKEENLKAISGIGDILILQKDGYATYSGFYGNKGPSSRMSYLPKDQQASLFAYFEQHIDQFSELDFPMPDGSVQKRLCFIRYDISRQQFIVLSRALAELTKIEKDITYPVRIIFLINFPILFLIAYWMIGQQWFGQLEDSPELSGNLRRLKIGLLLLTLIFFVFFQGLLRMQFMRHSMSDEYQMKLQTESLYLESAYQSFSDTFESANQMAETQYAGEVRRQATALSAIIRASADLGYTDKAHQWLKSINGTDGIFFWVIAEGGKPLLTPPASDVVLNDTSIGKFLEKVPAGKSGVLNPKDISSETSQYGYGVRTLPGGQSLFTLLPNANVQRKENGFKELRSGQITQLIREFSIRGSAAIIDKSLTFRHYTYANLQGKSVDTLSVEQGQKLSELMFHEKSGYFDYILLDPTTEKAKYRSAYINYNPKEEIYYLVSADKADIYRDINRLSTQYLHIIGNLAFLVLFSIGVFIAQHILRTRQEDES